MTSALSSLLVTHRGARTQAEVATAVGISHRTWSDYERGTYLPDCTTMEKFAVHVGLNAQKRGVLMDTLHREAGERNMARRLRKAGEVQS